MQLSLRITFASAINIVLAVEKFVVPGWDLESSSKAGNDLASLSSPAYDTSSWYHIANRSTVFAGLIEAGVFNTEQLFYSKNLQDTVDVLPYYHPWLYRAEFPLKPGQESHFFLQTNGITSKADIYLNGHEVADKLIQAGAYGGQTYDVTSYAKDRNALVIRAWPTDYNKDFALGFVDWNPYPPDNGTGVWRDVSVKQTGSLSMGPVRIVNDWAPGASSTIVSLKINVTNLESSSVTGSIHGTIQGGQGVDDSSLIQFKLSLELEPSETQTVTLNATLQNPKIWWPKQWGEQPLYTAQAAVYAQEKLSDRSTVQNFGIRLVTSQLNEYNDTMFTVNGNPFQVRGGGYAPDIFLRWDEAKFEAQAQYVLDMGLNTIRLEGKEEQPELYDVADRIGLMVLAGWECCDKWEGWSYNDEVTGVPLWNQNDYRTAKMSMRHEAAMLQSHPSILAFLVGSDYWPDDRAAAIYVDALHDFDWPNPIICSAAKRGFPEILGPSGMKMNGPYDWVPPNYWYYRKVGSAFGFGSEEGAGVGTPEIGSLQRFLTGAEMDLLWTSPQKGLYHMSTNVSSFHDRHRYDEGLWKRYGAPTSLEDYLLKAQMMDYEATRAEFEGFQAKWNAARPALGVIYWMLNNAWPSLHWNLFDIYLHPAGSYFGTKVGSRTEHVAYGYDDKSVYLINHSLTQKGHRMVDIELMDIGGKVLAKKTVAAQTVPNTSKAIATVPGLNKIKDVAFLRLLLKDSNGVVLSRNIYWLSSSPDVLEWNRSTWFYTPCKSFADFTALSKLKTASISASTTGRSTLTVTLQNYADVPAFFIRLNLVDLNGNDVVPVLWTDNYVTLWPHEKLELQVTSTGGAPASLQVSGSNIGPLEIKV